MGLFTQILIAVVLVICCSLVFRLSLRWASDRFLGLKAFRFHRLSAFGFGGILNVQWERQPSFPADQRQDGRPQAASVKIARIRPYIDRDAQVRKRFVGILVEGMTVRIPKSHIAARFLKHKQPTATTSDSGAQHSSKGQNDQNQEPEQPAKAVQRLPPSRPHYPKLTALKKALGAIILLAFRWLRSLVLRRLLIGIRFVDLRFIVEDTAQLDMNASVGLQHEDTLKGLNAPLAVYAAFSQCRLFSIADGRKGADATAVELPRSMWLSVRLSRLHRVSLWDLIRGRVSKRAFEFHVSFPHQEVLRFPHQRKDPTTKRHISAHEADIRVCVERCLQLFEKTRDYVLAAEHELDDASRNLPPPSPPPPYAEDPEWFNTEEASKPSQTSPARSGFPRDRWPTQKKPPIWLHYLNGVHLNLPAVECDFSPTQLKDKLRMRTRLNGLSLVAVLGEAFPYQTLEDKKNKVPLREVPGLENGHRDWIGGKTVVPIGFQASWDSWIWDLSVANPNTYAAVSDRGGEDLSNSRLKLGQMKTAVTSNFAPWHRLDYQLDELLCCEMQLDNAQGDLRYEAARDSLQLMLPIVRQRREAARHPSTPARHRPGTGVIPCMPRLVCHFEVGESVFRLPGPVTPLPSAVAWNYQDHLVLRLPIFSISTESQYREISLHRTPQERQDARDAKEAHDKLLNKRRRSLAQSASDGKPQESEQSISQAYNKPDPSDQNAKYQAPKPSETAFFQSCSEDVSPPTVHLFSDLSRHSAVYETSLVASTSHPADLSMHVASGQSRPAPASSTEEAVLQQEAEENVYKVHIASIGAISTTVTLCLPLLEDLHDSGLEAHMISGKVNLTCGKVDLAIWQRPVIACFESLLALIAAHHKPPISTKEPSTATAEVQSESKPASAPPSEIVFECAFEELVLQACGQDPKRDPDVIRGLSSHFHNLRLQAVATKQRSANRFLSKARRGLGLEVDALSLDEHERSQQPQAVIGIAAISVGGMIARPIFDHSASSGAPLSDNRSSPAKGGKSGNTHSEPEKPEKPKECDEALRCSSDPPDGRVVAFSGTTIRFAGVLLPFGESNSLPPQESTTRIRVKTSKIVLHFKLFHVYCCLLSFAALRQLKAAYDNHLSSQVAHRKSKSKTSYAWSVEAPDVWAHIVLDPDCRMFLRVESLDCSGPTVAARFSKALLAAPSLRSPGKWEPILQMPQGVIRASDSRVREQQTFSARLETDSLRLYIPYGLRPSRFVDTAVSLVKICKQLIYEVTTGKQDSIIEPHSEGPKHPPILEFSIRQVLIEAQDDPFENRLNVSRRVGAEEVLERLKREEALLVKQQEHGVPEWLDLVRQKLDSTNWQQLLQRHRRALEEQFKRQDEVVTSIQGPDKFAPSPGDPIELTNNRECPLLRAFCYDFAFQISPPSFLAEPNGVRDFLGEVGGLPHDRPYTLLIPLHLRWTMGACKITLRDYPLPLLYLPRAAPRREEQQCAWHFESDWTIAEQLPDRASIRLGTCELVPAQYTTSQQARSISAPRSAMPTQQFARPRAHIGSGRNVKLGWGNSMQPALSDVARVFDSLTKDSPDPSPRIGFWDKFRLMLHGDVEVTSAAELHLTLKGSRDPYALKGTAAGFVKIWRGNVKMQMNFDNADREFIQIFSNQYVLAIPDLRQYADAAATGSALYQSRSESLDASRNREREFPLDKEGVPLNTEIIKVVGTLVGGVRWGLGIKLERTCRPDTCENPDSPCEGDKFQRRCRFFDFKPHYDVKTRTKDGAEQESEGEITDSFDNFRSDFIHFSLSLVSPVASTAIPSSDGNKGELNGLRLAPYTVAHFWRWWELFDSSLSLPVRQGKMFKSPESAPKFGRTTATIKYRFEAVDFAISHVYTQETAVDWLHGRTTILGLKGLVRSLKIDLHQRSEEISLQIKELGTKRVYHKKFYHREVQADGLEVRMIAASFRNMAKQAAAESVGDFDTSSAAMEDSGREVSWMESIPSLPAEEQAQWEHADDFHDLGFNRLGDLEIIKVVPLIRTPLLSYTHNTASKNKHADIVPNRPKSKKNTPRASKFGNEPSHRCLNAAPSPLAVQLEMVDSRLQMLKALADDAPTTPLPGHSRTHRQELHARIQSAASVKSNMEKVSANVNSKATHVTNDLKTLFDHHMTENGFDPIFSEALSKDIPNWANRLILHQPEIQLTTISRDMGLKYYDSSKARKGENYQLSASAIKMLKKLQTQVNELQNEAKEEAPGETSEADVHAVDDAIRTHRSTCWSDEATMAQEDPGRSHPIPASHDAPDGIRDDWDIESRFLAVFIRPQFILKSDIDENSQVVVSANIAVMRTFAVQDPSTEDEMHSTILHRNYAELHGMQVFHPHIERCRLLYGHNSLSFVPQEVLMDNNLQYEFERLVGSTHASMRYDKFNRLRMATVGHSGFETCAPEQLQQGRDDITFSVGSLNVAATRRQFAAMIHIVDDLVLYTNPERKNRADQLENARLTACIDDLKHKIGEIEYKQGLIRQLRDAVSQPSLSDFEMFSVREQIIRETEKLSIQIQALQEAKQRQEGSNSQQTKGDLNIRAKCYQIQFSMLESDASGDPLHRSYTSPFVKAAINNLGFRWRSHKDGSISNQLVVGAIRAHNFAESAEYPEILYPVSDEALEGREYPLKGTDAAMAAMWVIRPPVGGISIVEDLRLHIHPIHLILEGDIGHRVWNFFFAAKAMGRTSYEAPDSSTQSSAITSSSSTVATNTQDDSSSNLSVVKDSSSNLLRPQTPTSQRSPNKKTSASEPSTGHRTPRHVPSLNDLMSGERSHTPSSLASDSEEVSDSEDSEELSSADVQTMLFRSKRYRAFRKVEVPGTFVFLTTKFQKKKFMDVYGLKAKTPHLSYEDEILSYSELFGKVRKDARSSLFHQSAPLINQYLTNARNPKNIPTPVGVIRRFVEKRHEDDRGKSQAGNASKSPSMPSSPEVKGYDMALRTPTLANPRLEEDHHELNASEHGSLAMRFADAEIARQPTIIEGADFCTTNSRSSSARSPSASIADRRSLPEGNDHEGKAKHISEKAKRSFKHLVRHHE